MSTIDPATSPPGISPPQGLEVRDAAWAKVPTNYRPEDLARELADVEVLLRLNPYYFFSVCKKTGERSYLVELENQSNQQSLKTEVDVEGAHEPEIKQPQPGTGIEALKARLKRGGIGCGRDEPEVPLIFA